MKQNTFQILLSYFILFVIGLFVAGCDLFGSGSDNTQPTHKETKVETFIPISPGALLPNGTLQEKLLAIAQRVDKNVFYDIAIDSDASYSPLIVHTQGENVTVKIHSASTATRTLTLNSRGSLFNVGANTTLILENIIVKGHPNNNRALISVTDGGTLIILDGTSIRDNQSKNIDRDWINQQGGGINVVGNSKLFMKGGEICYNTIEFGDGGGVSLRESFFSMTSGIIHNNDAEWDRTNSSRGGGVYNSSSTFMMNGGEIASNTALRGGGVYLSGRFIKEPLPNETRSGIIWGYPANGMENYANGAAVYWNWLDSLTERNCTFGEYDPINTDLRQGAYFGKDY